MASLNWSKIHKQPKPYDSADLKADIEKSSNSYCRTVNRLNKDDMVVELNKVEDMFKKAVENSDNKVQIAMQMYEMVSYRSSRVKCNGWGFQGIIIVYNGPITTLSFMVEPAYLFYSLRM